MKQSIFNKMLLKMNLCISLIFMCLFGMALIGISESKYKTSRILLNKCYGQFRFSTEFCIRYQKKYGGCINPFGVPIQENKTCINPIFPNGEPIQENGVCINPFGEPIQDATNDPLDTFPFSRMDPRILSIYDECSSVNAHRSNIVAEEVPDCYIDYIELRSFYGFEWVEINFQKKYELLLKTWDRKKI